MLTIRRAKLKDASSIFNLIEKARAEVECFGKRKLEYIKESIASYYVAELETEIVGVIQDIKLDFLDDTSEIRSLCVLKAHQKRGIGAKLIEAVVQNSQTKKIIVETTPPIQKLFENAGFKFIATLKDIYKTKSPAYLFETIKDYPEECPRCPDDCPGIMLSFTR